MLTKIIPPTEFGPDHWSTLLYVESRIVDGKGDLKHEQMRTYAYGKKGNYLTRLRGGKLAEEGHDDWACVRDFIACGWVTEEDEIHKLTDEGWRVAHQLRRFRGETHRTNEFVYSPDSSLAFKVGAKVRYSYQGGWGGGETKQADAVIVKVNPKTAVIRLFDIRANKNVEKRVRLESLHA